MPPVVMCFTLSLPLCFSHLQVNSYSLYLLGPTMEILCGAPRFIAIYGISAVISTAVSVAMTPAPSLGASGPTPGATQGKGLMYVCGPASMHARKSIRQASMRVRRGMQ